MVMCKSIWKLLLTAACILPVVETANARTITPDEARTVGAEFFGSRGTDRLASPTKLVLAHTAKDSRGEASYYVFNATDKHGYVMVSADDHAQPVLAYSYTNTFSTNHLPDNAKSVLGTLAGNRLIMTEADLHRQRSPRRVSGKKELGTATWNQYAPFNNQIPGRKLTGCVGLATAIVMKHHQYPPQGRGAVGNTTFSTPYDWANMRNDNYMSGYSDAQAQAVATLVNDAAQAILTDFGMSASSAFEVRVPWALINYFGYDPGVSFKKRSEMSRTDWDALIVSEIEANRPVIYSGQDVESGHAFVCDGYEIDSRGTFLHINWGWGGAANDFYYSDALNPRVSKQHNYNDQTTIIYNIKPGSFDQQYSPIHLTNEANQAGITADVSDLQAGVSFTLRAGAFKNLAHEPFNGQLSVALFSADGQLRHHLIMPRALNMQSLQVNDFATFGCQLPHDAAVAPGDYVALATQASGSADWLQVPGELLVVQRIPAQGYEAPRYNVNVTPTPGAIINAPHGGVIKGFDYAFNVQPETADQVVTVKANGYILSPAGNGNYTIGNVTRDQDIRVIVQRASDVVSKRYLYVTPGSLSSMLDETETASVTDLTLFGSIDVTDFNFIRERLRLQRLDLSGTTIAGRGSDPANTIPTNAFSGLRCLKRLILPSGVTTLRNGCFRETGLEEIDLPASISKWEYNVFYYTNSLRKVYNRRSQPAFINWCVFSGSTKAELIVPVGASAAYRAKDNWKDFKIIREENAPAVTSCDVTMQDAPGVRLTPITQGTTVAPNSTYEFSVETDGSMGDAMLEVFANNTKLVPGANGNYTALIMKNTLIYTRFKQPQATGVNGTWAITGNGGGVGMVSEVVNVVPGKTFNVRINAMTVPADGSASMKYALALTDAQDRVKEIISNVIPNYSYNTGDIDVNLSCQVREANVREGNRIRLVTSMDTKSWNIVKSNNPAVADQLSAVGNKVVYHTINMPTSVKGANMTGATNSVAHGMPLNLRITSVAADEVVTVTVDGSTKVQQQPVAEIKIPSVVKDMDITVQVGPKNGESYSLVTVSEGELGSKLSPCPSRLKIVGSMSWSDFDALRNNRSIIKALDLADVTIKGDLNKANTLPSYAFCPFGNSNTSALTTVILPTNLSGIEANAFHGCKTISTLNLPVGVTYIGEAAFGAMSGLTKLKVDNPVPAKLDRDPFPGHKANITLDVPQNTDNAYINSAFWSGFKMASVKYYNIAIDQSRAFSWSTLKDKTLYNIAITVQPPTSQTKNKTISVGLPSAPKLGSEICRPEQIFKIYDNGCDVFSDNRFSAFIGPVPPKTMMGTPIGTQYAVVFNQLADADPAYPNYPQNHKIDIVFFHRLDYTSNLPQGINCRMVNTPDSAIYRNVPWSRYVENRQGYEPIVYRERHPYYFVYDNVPTGMELSVTAISKVLKKPKVVTQSNVLPTLTDDDYNTVEQRLTCDENGVYTLPGIEGDTKLEVTLRVSENTEMTCEQLSNIAPEELANVESLGLSGDVTQEAIALIHDNMPNLESLDLSNANCYELPLGAFAGMEQLQSVSLPDNMVSIGDCAFQGCTSLQTITLNSVDNIGANAFNGCSNLTSIILNSNGSTAAATARRIGRKANVQPESFGTMNPNCIIYTANPNHAELAGTDNEPLYKVVINNSNGRKAANSMYFNTNSPLNIPAGFDLEGTEIGLISELRADVQLTGDNWTGVVLPFVPKYIMIGEDALPIDEAVEAIQYGETDWEVFGLTNDSYNQFKANQPFFARLRNTANMARVRGEAVPVAFLGGELDGVTVTSIDATPAPEEVVNRGRLYNIYGTYSGHAAAEGDLLVNAAGSHLSPFDAELQAGAQVAPFGVYARLADNSFASPDADYQLYQPDVVTDVAEVSVDADSQLRFVSLNGQVAIVAQADCTAQVFDPQGRLLTTLTLKAGYNTVDMPAGIYIIAGRKVIF